MNLILRQLGKVRGYCLYIMIGKWGVERINNLPKTTCKVDQGFEPRFDHFKFYALKQKPYFLNYNFIYQYNIKVLFL